MSWFKVNRQLFESELWLSEPFTKAQAWIDLFGSANHRDGNFWIRGNQVKIKRGQIGWSEVTMSERWRWSRNKVRRFLNWLESEQQIEQQKDRYITTIITILNYEKYQSETADDTAERQQKDSRRYINKNDKKKKNDKNNTIKLYEDKWTLEQVAQMVVEAFNVHLGKRFKDYKSFLKGLERWLEVYTPQEIEQAILKVKTHSFWKDKMTPVILFRQKNPQGETVDYISGLLNNQNP